MEPFHSERLSFISQHFQQDKRTNTFFPLGRLIFAHKINAEDAQDKSLHFFNL
jgi:hypothetical protein